MTWDEFKKVVDDELQKRGYDGSTVEVRVIDVSYPYFGGVVDNVRLVEDENGIVDLDIY